MILMIQQPHDQGLKLSKHPVKVWSGKNEQGDSLGKSSQGHSLLLYMVTQTLQHSGLIYEVA